MTSSPQKLWAKAVRYANAGQTAPARAALDALLVHQPQDVNARLALFKLELDAGNFRKATVQALDAARCLQAGAEWSCRIATALMLVGENAAALDCLNQVVLTDGDPGELILQVAILYQMLGEHDNALTLMELSHRAGADDRNFYFCRAIQLIIHGRRDEAESDLERCGSFQPPPGKAMAQLSRMRKQTRAANHLQQLEKQLMVVSPGSEDQAALEFARYKELEDLEEYNEAWSALSRANAVMHDLLRHDSAREEALAEKLIERTKLLPGQGLSKANGPEPIFIIGMPRSGTTLLDRMLSIHSQVHSAGELGVFYRSLQWATDHPCSSLFDELTLESLPRVDFAELGLRYLRNSQWLARGHRFYIDKMPRNWWLAGVILAALPGARILRVVREPIEICFSNYRAYFGADYAYSYDMTTLANHHRHYSKVMEHWRSTWPNAILDVSYNDLVQEPERVLRGALEFCGLEWEPSCSDLSLNHEPTATPSALQVREPLHQRASGAWKPYATQLEELRKMLAP